MILFIPFIIVVLVIGFWAWMWNDMLHNDDIPPFEPQAFRWPPIAKNQWMALFIVLNIFTAGYYYLTIYRSKV